MTARLSLRSIAMIIALTLAWCVLWQSLSVANVLSGLLFSTAIVFTDLGPPGKGGVRLVPLARLGWLVFVDLVGSTKEVATEILTPTDYTDEGIIAVTVSDEARDHLLLLSVAITLTPGTAVVDVDPHTGTLYLHLLHIDRRDETIEHVHDLARLSVEALPAERQGVTA